MKKVLFMALAIGVFTLYSCNGNKKNSKDNGLEQSDSLSRIIEQKDNEINDMMGTINEIQEGLREINEAENRVNIVKNGEGTSKSTQIKENIQFISTTMTRNRELIQKLRQQLRESSFKGEQFKKTISSLMQQIEDKEMQLKQLRAELSAKDIHIAELDETIGTLNTSVNELTEESNKKTETISTQDKQLNTAWYVFGTKKELKEQRILADGKLMLSNFNKNYFTKIDIRVDREIRLYTKSAKILTVHPADSYKLSQDASNQYVLRINNPDLFWSTSKYLVVLVK
ncbi:MAG: hypothetical protein ACTTHI_02035 [Prevotella sp.]